MLMHADKKRARGRGRERNRQRRSYLFQSDIDFAWANIARWSELNILSAQMRGRRGVSRGSWERLLSPSRTHPYHSPIPHVSTSMPSYYVLPALHCQASFLVVSTTCPATMCTHTWRFFSRPGYAAHIYHLFTFRWVPHTQPRNGWCIVLPLPDTHTQFWKCACDRDQSSGDKKHSRTSLLWFIKLTKLWRKFHCGSFSVESDVSLIWAQHLVL